MHLRIIAIAALLCLAGGIAHAGPQYPYTITDLGTLGGDRSCAFSINSGGEITGWAMVASGAGHAFLYSGGVMKDLGTLGGAQSNGFALNDAGQVTGLSNTSDPTHYYDAFVATAAGGMQNIGTLGGNESVGYAINAAGQVAGESIGADGQLAHPFLYSPGGPMVDLGTFGGQSGRARGINQLGQVVGWAQTTSGDSHAFLYNGSGRISDLGTLGGVASYAQALNDRGEIVGDAYTADGNRRAFLYAAGAMRNLGVLPGTDYSYATSINDAGQTVGGAYGAVGGPAYAFLYSGGVMQDLNTLVDPSSGLVMVDATAIADDGRIVGYGFVGGAQHAFLLTPAPEPSTMFLTVVAAGVLFLFGFCRRTPGSRGKGLLFSGRRVVVRADTTALAVERAASITIGGGMSNGEASFLATSAGLSRLDCQSATPVSPRAAAPRAKV